MVIHPIWCCLQVGLRCFCFSLFFDSLVGDHVIARWKNNHYYGGKIASISPTRKSVGILFDDGDEITHPLGDVTAVLPDKKPNFIKYYDHVIAPWKGSYKQYIGFVIEMRPNGTFKVLFDDRDEAWYTINQVRILPQTSSTHEGKLIKLNPILFHSFLFLLTCLPVFVVFCIVFMYCKWRVRSNQFKITG